MITKSNIEEKLFDYFEGILTSSEKLEVEQFIKDHPVYQSDFEAWEKSYLPQEDYVYEHVDELLVPEKGGISFFKRWKPGVLLLLVSAVCSVGLYQKINGGQKNTLAQSNTESEQLIKSELVNADDRAQTSKITEETEDLLTNKTAESLASNELQKKKVLSGEANQRIRIRRHNSGLSANTGRALARNKTQRNRLSNAPKVTSGMAGAQHSHNATLGTKLQEVLQANDRNYDLVEIGLITSSVEGFSSVPNLKKSRSKFQKYDKNELTFVNNKDPYFALPNGLLTAMNPSFVGNGKGVRLSYNYNYQWPEITDNYNTHQIAVDAYVNALKGGVGIMLTNDILGHNQFSEKGVAVIYSPKITLGGNTTLEPSVKYGYYQRSVAWNQLKTNVLVDQRTGVLNVEKNANSDAAGASKSNYGNAGFGLLLNTSKIFVGFAYDHLLNARLDFDGNGKEMAVPGRLTAQVGGSLIPLKDLDFLMLSPSLHFVKSGGYDKIWLSNVLKINNLLVGTSYSFNNDGLLSVGYENQLLRVSYAYGRTKSIIEADAAHLSMHQVGLVFNFVPKK